MTESKKGIGSNLAKVDAYVNTDADYEELPEITDEQFARAEEYQNGVRVPRRDRPPAGETPER